VAYSSASTIGGSRGTPRDEVVRPAFRGRTILAGGRVTVGLPSTDVDEEEVVTAIAYVLGAVGLVAIIAGVAAYRRAASDGWQVLGIVGGTVGADLVVIATALALR
jgi:hypothetical protein